MPPSDVIRGDHALETYLGLPRGALAKRRLHGRPVPPGVLLPHAKRRFYVIEDVMVWLRAHAEPDSLNPPGVRKASAIPLPPDTDSVARRRRGRPKKIRTQATSGA